jgi:hypothetical protein
MVLKGSVNKRQLGLADWEVNMADKNKCRCVSALVQYASWINQLCGFLQVSHAPAFIQARHRTEENSNIEFPNFGEFAA